MKVSCLAFWMLLASIISSQVRGAEQPILSQQFSQCWRNIAVLSMRTPEDRLMKLSSTLVCYNAYYNAHRRRPEEVDNLLAIFRGNHEMLQRCKDMLGKLLSKLTSSESLVSRVGMISRIPGIFASDFNAINFLLDIIAPDTQVGGQLINLLETIHLDEDYLGNNEAASQIGIPVSVIFACVITRLIVGGAEEKYIDSIVAQIIKYQDNLILRRNFDSQMRVAFSYFISKLQLIKIDSKLLDKLRQTISPLVSESPVAATPSPSPNLRQAGVRLDPAALSNLTARFGGLSS